MKSNRWQEWVVLSDIQIPYQDPKALAAAVAFTKSVKPHGVVLNGDIVDCYAISDYDKDPTKALTHGLQKEVDGVQELLADLKDANEKLWLLGNHEDRWRRLLWRIPGLAGVSNLTFDKVFAPESYGFSIKPYGAFIELGHLMVTHGFIVRQKSAYSAQAHFQRLGTSVLVGHTHRLGAHYHTNRRGPHVALENGCLCKLSAEYVQFPDWQQGFTYVTVDTKDGSFLAQQIPILSDYTIIFGKEKYKV